jgi:hypothetical protein
VFSWRYLDNEGQVVGSSDRFDERDAAESWLGIAWADLSASGIEEVELFDDERGERLYRMSLGQDGTEF